jgi:hypothetical protein
MANRDYDDPRYGRSESERDDWRDQSNRGSRDWDRGGDDFRSQGRDFSGRSGYGQSSSRHGESERGFAQVGQYGMRPEQYRNQEDRREGQGYGRSDYRSADQGRYSDQTRGQGGYGQGSYSSNTQSAYGRDWGHSSSYDQRGGRPDFSRTQSNYGARESYGTQPFGEGGYRQEWDRTNGPAVSDWGDRRDFGGYRGGDFQRGEWRQETRGGQGGQGGRDEDWGDQLRQGVQQMASRVKRAFRGPKGYKRSDDRIREDVSDRLAHQDELDPSDIEVMVSNGEVTLSGTVQSRHEKFIAEEIADSVSGVSDVHNQLRVRREDVQSTTATSTSATVSENTRQRNARA